MSQVATDDLAAWLAAHVVNGDGGEADAMSVADHVPNAAGLALLGESSYTMIGARMTDGGPLTTGLLDVCGCQVVVRTAPGEDDTYTVPGRDDVLAGIRATVLAGFPGLSADADVLGVLIVLLGAVEELYAAGQ
jgi:hypothetical protein